MARSPLLLTTDDTVFSMTFDKNVLMFVPTARSLLSPKWNGNAFLNKRQRVFK